MEILFPNGKASRMGRKRPASRVPAGICRGAAPSRRVSGSMTVGPRFNAGYGGVIGNRVA